MTCTFFGNRDIYEDIRHVLYEVTENLIVQKGVDTFYVGNHGRYDACVQRVLTDLKKKYPHIRCSVVLAYLPVKKEEYGFETVYPSALENTPPKFAVVKRNHWMISESDYVVSYVKSSFGNAAKYKDYAVRKGKTVIELA